MISITEYDLDLLLNQYKNERPFLKHIEQFADEGLVTVNSICQRQSKLTGENRIKTYAIGQGIIHQANQNNPQYISNSCPYANGFSSQEILTYLRHPCDTGNINDDGSINIEALKKMVLECFTYDATVSSYVMLESVLENYLKTCVERDLALNINIKPHWYLPSFETVSKIEWGAFFNLYSDRIIDSERAVTIRTFLQFYFEPDVLNDKVSADRVLNDNVI